MKVLIVSETLTAGGAETFALRLTTALLEKKVEAMLYVFYKDKINKELLAQYPSIIPVTPTIPFQNILSKLDSLLLKLKIDFSIIEYIIQSHLKKTIAQNKISVVHGNLFKTDTVILKSLAQAPSVNFITTNHGDYTQYFKRLASNEHFRVLNFRKKVNAILSRINSVVCITDDQVAFIKEYIKQHQNFSSQKPQVEKIYNGYYLIPSKKSDLVLPDSTFVFGMVARGIKEKGWEHAIECFNKLNKPDTALILVGESDYLLSLKKKYQSNTSIHFVGFSENPSQWIRLFDVGLLPSYYSAESLPTVIIEYLAHHKPVICTNIGDCVKMLQYGNELAGEIVRLQDNSINTEDLQSAMQKLLDKNLYTKKKQLASFAYQKFDMDTCVQHYLSLYNTIK